jgi:sugar O-acyltransferase (sialic acid O-acetyltransferase NeuD family)
LHHGKEDFAKWKAGFGGQPLAGLVAIGGGNMRGRERLELLHFLEGQGVEVVSVVHPTAFVAKDAVLRKGCQVLAQAAVCTEVRLGEGCIIQTAASVDHESILGDGVNLSPGVRIAGCVEVGSLTQFGVGAVVLPRIKIGRNAVIGAGTLITEDVPDNAVVERNPGP